MPSEVLVLLLDLRQHVVEAGDEGADLVVTRPGDADAVVAIARHARRSVGQPDDRSGHQLLESRGDQERDDPRREDDAGRHRGEALHAGVLALPRGLNGDGADGLASYGNRLHDLQRLPRDVLAEGRGRAPGGRHGGGTGAPVLGEHAPLVGVDARRLHMDVPGERVERLLCRRDITEADGGGGARADRRGEGVERREVRVAEGDVVVAEEERAGHQQRSCGGAHADQDQLPLQGGPLHLPLSKCRSCAPANVGLTAPKPRDLPNQRFYGRVGSVGKPTDPTRCRQADGPPRRVRSTRGAAGSRRPARTRRRRGQSLRGG